MNRARMLKIAIPLLLAAVPAAYGAVRVGQADTALDRSLRNIGFYPLKPPSTLVGPGSIYHVSRDGKFYRTICKVDAAEIESVVERSPSEETIARELQKANYSLGAEPIRAINAKLEGEVVASANYSLIPSPIDQNRCAHWRSPMDMIRQG